MNNFLKVKNLDDNQIKKLMRKILGIFLKACIFGYASLFFYLEKSDEQVIGKLIFRVAMPFHSRKTRRSGTN